MEAGREGRSGVSVPSRLKVNIITSVGQVGSPGQLADGRMSSQWLAWAGGGGLGKDEFDD